MLGRVYYINYFVSCLQRNSVIGLFSDEETKNTDSLTVAGTQSTINNQLSPL